LKDGREVKKSKLHWEASAHPAENARTVLPNLARDYFQHGKKAARPETSEGELHEFRLATKRFRYTLEMFTPVYGPGLEARIKQIRQVQQVLGDVQDCQAVRTMDPIQSRAPLVTWLERRLGQKKAEFQKLWREQFSSEQIQTGWLRYLDRYTRAPK
jgi:CHAD domain-containing protein